MDMYNHAQVIIDEALRSALPDNAVKRALAVMPDTEGELILVSVGKAAWQMANAAVSVLKDRISRGIVITKYDHSKGSLGHIEVFEAGHPVPDENTFTATEAVIRMVNGLSPSDRVLLLISGGGSALFEKPLIPPAELSDITRQLLACGADIVEMNTIRKRLSTVKGGRFAELCAPAQVFSVVLSDIVGDPLDMIASGPAYPDSSTCEQARRIVEKYSLRLSDAALSCLDVETPKALNNVETHITGSVRQLCASAVETCKKLGYEPCVLTDSLTCEAREAGSFLAAIARTHRDADTPLAFIAGGETVVHLTGKGLGGRNQEIALSAARGIDGLTNTIVFSVGSDGTDGPTDAAGGIVDGCTAGKLRSLGIDISDVLENNDAYHGLKACNGLIITGPTGTNVNDLCVLLIGK